MRCTKVTIYGVDVLAEYAGEVEYAKKLSRKHGLRLGSILDLMNSKNIGVDGAVELLIKRRDNRTFFIGEEEFTSINRACEYVGIDSRRAYQLASEYDLGVREFLQLYHSMKTLPKMNYVELEIVDYEEFDRYFPYLY